MIDPRQQFDVWLRPARENDLKIADVLDAPAGRGDTGHLGSPNSAHQLAHGLLLDVVFGFLLPRHHVVTRANGIAGIRHVSLGRSADPLGGSFLLAFILRASRGTRFVVRRPFVSAFSSIGTGVFYGLVFSTLAVLGILRHFEAPIRYCSLGISTQ